MMDEEIFNHENVVNRRSCHVAYDILGKRRAVEFSAKNSVCYSQLDYNKKRSSKIIKVRIPKKHTLYGAKQIKEYINNLNASGVFTRIYKYIIENDQEYQVFVKIPTGEKSKERLLATLTALRYLWEANSIGGDYRYIPSFYNHIIKKYSDRLTNLECFTIAHYSTKYNFGHPNHCLLSRRKMVFKSKEEIIASFKLHIYTVHSIYTKEVEKNIKPFLTNKELDITIDTYIKNR